MWQSLFTASMSYWDLCDSQNNFRRTVVCILFITRKSFQKTRYCFSLLPQCLNFHLFHIFSVEFIVTLWIQYTFSTFRQDLRISDMMTFLYISQIVIFINKIHSLYSFLTEFPCPDLSDQHMFSTFKRCLKFRWSYISISQRSLNWGIWFP